MTIEELQAQVLELQTEKETLTTDLEKYKEKEEASKTIISDKDKTIDDLRKFNNDLFMRTQQKQQKEDKSDNITSISDIINKLGK